jgi:hypothetical protein
MTTDTDTDRDQQEQPVAEKAPRPKGNRRADKIFTIALTAREKDWLQRFARIYAESTDHVGGIANLFRVALDFFQRNHPPARKASLLADAEVDGVDPTEEMATLPTVGRPPRDPMVRRQGRRKSVRSVRPEITDNTAAKLRADLDRLMSRNFGDGDEGLDL